MATRSPTLEVTFFKDTLPWWEAVRATGGRIRGGHMPIGHGVIPHDLAHFATEAHFGIEHGFWGLLARGATFKRGTDRRRTRPGRSLVAEHRDDLHAAEQLGNAHHSSWLHGGATPVGPMFDALAERWLALPAGGGLCVSWTTNRAALARAR